MNYQVPSNFASTSKSNELVADANAYYVRMVSTGNFTNLNSTACLDTIRSFSCVSRFPKCRGSNTASGIDYAQCRSTCENAFYCGNFFARGNFSIPDVGSCGELCTSGTNGLLNWSMSLVLLLLIYWVM